MKRILIGAVVLMWFAGCHAHDDGGPQADEYFYGCEGNPPAGITIFATDESFGEFANQEAAVGLKTDDVQAPKLVSPAVGSTISGNVPPAFTFKATPMALFRGTRPGASPAACKVERSRWAAVSRFLSWEGTAYAHCTAVNGDNYLFRVSKDGQTKPLYTAQLSVTTFTPGAAKWKGALAGLSGQMVTLTLARAIYSKGAITNGPFVASTPIKFTVGP